MELNSTAFFLQLYVNRTASQSTRNLRQGSRFFYAIVFSATVAMASAGATMNVADIVGTGRRCTIVAAQVLWCTCALLPSRLRQQAAPAGRRATLSLEQALRRGWPIAAQLLSLAQLHKLTHRSVLLACSRDAIARLDGERG